MLLRNLYCLARIGEQQIAVPSAGIDQAGARELQPHEQLIQNVLHQNFQIEAPRPESLQGSRTADGIDELLNAGHIHRIQEECLLLPHPVCFVREEGLLII